MAGQPRHLRVSLKWRGMTVCPMRTTLLAVMVAAVGAIGCATNPVTGEREFNLMSESQEIAIGQEMDQQVRQEMGVYNDAELQSYVEGVGLRLASTSQRPDLPWHFTIVDSPAVNAFALPGGYIYITRGILSYLNDEAELAGVLGHEIGHVTARHAARQYSRATGTDLGLTVLSIFVPGARPAAELGGVGLSLLFLKYGREDEMQADRLGVEYSVGTGWDPRGVPDLLTTLARIDELTDRRGTPNYLSTHPEPADRVTRITPVVQELEARAPNPQLAVNRAEYLRRVDGLLVGDNPRDGIVRGSELLHPDLRFAVKFPDGWEINNGQTQVLARQPGADVYMLLDVVERPRSRNLERLGMDDMERAGFRPLDGSATQINGLDAFSGTFRGNLRGIGQVIARATYVNKEGRIYRLVGFAPPSLFDQIGHELTESQRSFRSLSRNEAADIRPNQLSFHTVRDGETWQSIAQGPGQGNVRASTLAIMNSFSPNEQPRPGDRIKIVVSG